MGLDIEMKVSGTVDRNNIQSIRQSQRINGASQRGSIAIPQTVRGALGEVKPTPRPVQPPPPHTVHNSPSPQYQQTQQHYQQAPQPRAPQPPVQPAQPPKKPAPPLPAGGQELRRGQKIPLSANGQPLRRLRIGLRWKVRDPRCELDASSFLLGQNNLVPSDAWFVFYGQDTSPDRSIHYRGYEGGDGSDIDIDLSMIDQQIQRITIAVTIYEAVAQRLDFSMVDSVKAVLIDASRSTAVASLDLTDGSAGVTALVVGEIYRHNGEWKFNSVGSGMSRDLADFCKVYGVEID